MPRSALVHDRQQVMAILHMRGANASATRPGGKIMSLEAQPAGYGPQHTSVAGWGYKNRLRIPASPQAICRACYAVVADDRRFTTCFWMVRCAARVHVPDALFLPKPVAGMPVSRQV